MRLPMVLTRWMERRHGDTGGPTILHYRRVYILPTRHGFLFAAIIMVMWLAAINYDNNMGFLLTFLLGGIFLALMHHTFATLVGLRVIPLAPEPVFAGQTAAFPLQLHNDGTRQRNDIGVGIDSAAHFYDIPPGEHRRALVRVVASERGRLLPGRVTLDTSYPGGLFRTWSWIKPGVPCLVYPRPEANGPEPPARGLGTGRHGRRAAGDDDFDGLRRYRRGDPIRHIAWKATSARELQVKQFSGGEGEELLLSWADTADLASTEQRLSRLCHWILLADRRGLRYGLWLPDTNIPAASGDQHREACLASLAEFDP